MHVHMHTHTCIHIYMYTYTYTYTYIHTWIHIHTHMLIHVHIHIYIYICLCTHIYIYIYIYRICTSCREREANVYDDVHNMKQICVKQMCTLMFTTWPLMTLCFCGTRSAYRNQHKLVFRLRDTEMRVCQNPSRVATLRRTPW